MNKIANQHNAPWRAYVLLTISCIGMAFGAPAYMKLYQTGMSETEIVSYFLLIGGAASVVFSIILGETPHVISHFMKSSVRDKLSLGAVGVIWPVYFLCFIGAMKVSSITEVSLVIRTSPVLVVILSVIFLSEKVKSWPRILSAVALCIAGVLIVRPGGDGTVLTLALLLALVVSVTAAISEMLRVVISRSNRSDTMSKLRIIGITMCIGGILLIGYELGVGRGLSVPTLAQVLWLLFLGLATVAIPAQLNLVAYHMLGSQIKVSLFTYFVPIYTAVIAYVWNGERIDPSYFIIGFMLIVTGVAVALYSIKK
jgi:drug/metabolite transporter (DMT)-like permease